MELTTRCGETAELGGAESDLVPTMFQTKDMKDVEVKADHVEFLTDVVAQTYW